MVSDTSNVLQNDVGIFLGPFIALADQSFGKLFEALVGTLHDRALASSGGLVGMAVELLQSDVFACSC